MANTGKRSSSSGDARVTGEAPGSVKEQGKSEGEALGEARTDAQSQVHAPDAPVQVGSEQGAAGQTATLRLPFVTASFTRTPGGALVPNSVAAAAGVGQAAASAAVSVVSSVPREKVLFYTGVAALGVVGVVEWPVAALVATGTYVASRARGRGQQSKTRPAADA